jgi:hypothetical protein
MLATLSPDGRVSDFHRRPDLDTQRLNMADTSTGNALDHPSMVQGNTFPNILLSCQPFYFIWTVSSLPVIFPTPKFTCPDRAYFIRRIC